MALLDYFVELSKGKVGPNVPINKFGRNPDIDTGPADIWPVANQVWVPPTAPRIHEIVSTSLNDADAGTGTQKVLVFGLVDNWTEDFEEVTLDGTNPVVTLKSYCRINMIMQSVAGSSHVNEGTITITAQVDVTIQDIIPIGAGKGHSARFTIPFEREGIVKKIIISLNRAAGTGNARSKILLLTRQQIDTNPLIFELANFDTNINATQPVLIPVDITEPIPAMSDVFINVPEVTESNTDISGSIQMVVSEKKKPA